VPIPVRQSVIGSRSRTPFEIKKTQTWQLTGEDRCLCQRVARFPFTAFSLHLRPSLVREQDRFAQKPQEKRSTALVRPQARWSPGTKHVSVCESKADCTLLCTRLLVGSSNESNHEEPEARSPLD
jgi:hypothetical protein